MGLEQEHSNLCIQESGVSSKIKPKCNATGLLRRVDSRQYAGKALELEVLVF